MDENPYQAEREVLQRTSPPRQLIRRVVSVALLTLGGIFGVIFAAFLAMTLEELNSGTYRHVVPWADQVVFGAIVVGLIGVGFWIRRGILR